MKRPFNDTTNQKFFIFDLQIVNFPFLTNVFGSSVKIRKKMSVDCEAQN